MDIEHPRKSKCNCPHTKDKRIICKHIVALYFTIFPKEAIKFVEDAEIAEKEYEEYEDKIYNKTIDYINKMSKKDLQQSLIDIFDYAPEWVYEHFVSEYIGWK